MGKDLDAASAQLGSFCSQLYSSGTASSVPDWSSLASLVSVKPNEAFSVPTQVNYVVKGGAYGSSASSNPISGSFVFSSYRDPNLKKTLDTYDGAATYLKELKVDDAELTKAIVAAIGDLDSPLGPDQKGMASLRHYLQGTTLEQRKKWRSQVLNASPADFKRFGDRLAALGATAAVFASASGIDDANQEGAALTAEKLL